MMALLAVAAVTGFVLLALLQMGFRTLAIEQRSSEVFLKFGGVVEEVNRDLETARNQMDLLATRTRVVTRKLRDVQELPESDAKLLPKLSPLDASVDIDDDDDAWVETR
ncbi:MAG TPA: hypothetical protein VHW00_09425 [Thermoanaerobaculia bacterium]|nr:hypothetical protein [Thermoanaerobaculia bacterium]